MFGEHQNLSYKILFLHLFWTHFSLILFKFFLVEDPTVKLLGTLPTLKAI